jgi:serine/threonine-protein kinase
MKECTVCARCFEDTTGRCPTDSSALAVTLPGSALLDGTYRLERRLGQGGMGVVYRALHEGVKRVVAVKLIRAERGWDASSLARFRVEAEALGKLAHPNIVNVTDSGVDPREGGIPYLVTEFLEGASLDEHAARAGPLSLAEALPMLEAVAKAVDFAHERGVLHRDLKPQNVWLAGAPSDGGSVKLLDFGLALLRREGPDAHAPTVRATPSPRPEEYEPDEQVTLDVHTRVPPRTGHAPPEAGDPRAPHPSSWGNGLTRNGQLAGTPLYMAPERFVGGAVSPAADVYSLGVLAYRLLTGREPFLGSLAAVARGHVQEDPPPPSSQRPTLPFEVDEPILSALAKEPSRRPPRARDVVAGLRRAELAARRREWRRREWPRRAALGAALTVLVLVMAAALPRVGAVGELEGRTVDARFRSVPLRPPDPRLLLVVLDEASLAADPTPLPQLGDEAGRRLERVFAAGARGVGIDLVLPEAWSRSPSFSRFVLRRADAVVLAGLATPQGALLGPEGIQGLTSVALGPELAASLFGLVNVDEDADGIVRRARLRYPRPSAPDLDSWAARVARLAGPSPRSAAAGGGERTAFLLDHTVDVGRFPLIPWARLPETLEREPALFAGKLVLVGGDLAGSGDMHRIPSRTGAPEAVPGIVLQAVAVDTILSGFPVREAGGQASGALFVTACALCFFALLASPRLLAATAALTAALCLGVAAAFGVFLAERVVVEMAGPLIAVGLGVALAVALRARLRPFPAAGPHGGG